MNLPKEIVQLIFIFKDIFELKEKLLYTNLEVKKAFRFHSKLAHMITDLNCKLYRDWGKIETFDENIFAMEDHREILRRQSKIQRNKILKLDAEIEFMELRLGENYKKLNKLY